MLGAVMLDVYMLRVVLVTNHAYKEFWGSDDR